MNDIVLLTNFSSASENAMQFAAKMAKKLGSTLYLFTSYQLPVSMNDVPVIMIPPDDLRKNAEASLDRAKNMILKNHQDISIKTESRLGDTDDELNDFCKELKPVVVIMGVHHEKGIEKLLFSDDSLSVMRHSTIPVIAIPENYEVKDLKRIALAFDDEISAGQQKEIEAFVQLLQARLYIIHVKTKSDEQEVITSSIFSSITAEYHTIQDENFIHGIESFADANEIDAIILLPEKHGIFHRLFSGTHTGEALNKLPIPIIVVRKNE